MFRLEKRQEEHNDHVKHRRGLIRDEGKGHKERAKNKIEEHKDNVERREEHNDLLKKKERAQ